MNQLRCEVCGGETLIKEADVFRCADCGAYYSPAALRSQLQARTPEASATDAQPTPPPVPSGETPKQRYLQKLSTSVPFSEVIPRAEDEDTESHGRHILRIIGCCVPIAFFLFMFCMIIWGVMDATGISPDNEFANQLAREEIVDTWQAVDSDIVIEHVGCTGTTSTELSNEEKLAYLDQRRANSTRYTVDGVPYENFGAYLDAIEYDHTQHIWRTYYVTGTYKVADSVDTYTGTFQVEVLEKGGLSWEIRNTEVSVPEQLIPYA